MRGGIERHARRVRVCRDAATMSSRFVSASRATSSTAAASRRSGARRSTILDRAPGIEWEYLPEVVPAIDAGPCGARTTRSTSTRARVPGGAVARARLPPACRRAARRRLRLGRRRGDDARRRARHQHAERDAAAGGDDRAHVRPRARRPAVPQGSAHAHRPLARAHGPHGARADRPHARRRRRRPHRQGAARAWRGRSTCGCVAADPHGERRRAPLSRRAQASRSTTCCGKRTSSSCAACSTTTTRHLFGEREFAQMRHERVLHQRCARADRRRGGADRGAAGGRIAGAALDVFEQEPVDPDNPLLAMDNVIVTPHALCWTDECFHNMASIGLAQHRRRARGPATRVHREPNGAESSARSRIRACVRL